MQDSVRALQAPLIKAVEDFGEISIDLQSIGMEQYAQSLEKFRGGLGYVKKCTGKALDRLGVSPIHTTKLDCSPHFAGGKTVTFCKSFVLIPRFSLL